MSWDRNQNWLLSCNKWLGHWSEAWENNFEWSGKCSMRPIYLNGLGNGGYLYRYFSLTLVTTREHLLKEDVMSRWAGQPILWRSNDLTPQCILTPTEPSVSKMEISCFDYGISKLLASEAYLTSSMIAQETSYLNWILTVFMNSFWSGGGSDYPHWSELIL